MQATPEAVHGGGRLGIVLVAYDNADSIGRLLEALGDEKRSGDRIVLVDTADTLAAFPTQPGRVTVLALTPAKRIQKISYWDPAREPLAGFLE